MRGVSPGSPTVTIAFGGAKPSTERSASSTDCTREPRRTTAARVCARRGRQSWRRGDPRGEIRSAAGSSSLAVLLTALLGAPTVLPASEDNIDTERTLSEILQDKRLQEAKASGDVSKRDTTVEQELRERQKEQMEGTTKSRRAILPQIGFSPEKGASGGIKFTDRDVGGLTLDVSGLAAQQGQSKAQLSMAAPAV